MAILGYVLIAILTFLAMPLYGRVMLLVSLWLTRGGLVFPGVGGIFLGIYYGLLIHLVAIFFPVAPGVCWWILFVDLLLMFPLLHSPISASILALATLSLINRLFPL